MCSAVHHLTNYGHNQPPKEGTDFSEEEHVHRTPRRCRSDAATTATSKIRNEAYSDIDSSRSTSDTEWANGGNVSENVTLYSPSTVRLVRSRNGRNSGSTRGKRRGGRKGTGSAKSSSRYSSMESNSALVQQRLERLNEFDTWLILGDGSPARLVFKC